jgi:hypothetical protein
MKNVPFLHEMRAWRLETYPSGSTQSLSGSRPIVPPMAENTFRSLDPGVLPWWLATSSVSVIA